LIGEIGSERLVDGLSDTTAQQLLYSVNMAADAGLTVYGEDLSDGMGWLYKKVLKPARKQAKGPPPGAVAIVHYVGRLLDGTVFDSSRERDEPFRFIVGARSVILGWDKGVAKMKTGELAQLRCAPEYAYGKEGRPGVIPENSTLVFDVELLEWKEAGSAEGGTEIMSLLVVLLVLIACLAPFMRDWMDAYGDIPLPPKLDLGDDADY